MGYFSDTLETSWGKRIPVYLVSLILLVPPFLFIFWPAPFAVGYDYNNPIPNSEYFFILPSIMLIGQGGMQLTHLSIMNSITYDQRHRDKLINYRNSCAYAAGIFVPAVSFISFSNVKEEFDQYFWIALTCCIVGVPSAVFFIYQIDEPKLVAESRRIYDNQFMEDDAEFFGRGKTYRDFSEEINNNVPQFGKSTKQIEPGNYALNDSFAESEVSSINQGQRLRLLTDHQNYLHG